MHSANVDPEVAALKRATDTPSVSKIELANVRSFYPEGAIIAVEGDIDKAVHSQWIGRCSQNLTFEFLVCKGKRSAKQLCGVLARDLGNLAKDVFFIVDRDFDDLEGFSEIDSVFMLDRYSIENYLVDGVVLDRLLSHAYPCNGYPDLRSKIGAIFLQDYVDFLRLSAAINFRIFIGRKLKMDIDDLMPKSINDFIQFEIGRVEATGKDASEIVKLPYEPSEDVIEGLAEEFYSLDPSERYRGKFAMKFFRAWLDKLTAELKSGKLGIFSPLTGKDYKVLSEELSFGAMARSSTLPNGLEAFLQNNLVPVGSSSISTT